MLRSPIRLLCAPGKCIRSRAPATPVCRPFAAGSGDLPAGNAETVGGGRGRGSWGWVLLFPAAFAGFLGCWQVGRYRWKVELLERRAEGLQEAPSDILALPSLPPEYSRVTASGVFRHADSVYIGPRPRTVMGTANPGFTLITPLVSDEWSRGVLVNRGWVPAQWRTDAALRALNCPTEAVTVGGVVRVSEARSGFVPDNVPARGEWYWIDVPGIAGACGLAEDTPLVEVYAGEDAGETVGQLPTSMDVLSFKARAPKAAALYPIPKPAEELMRASVTPVDHRNYALTWFTLSGATAFLAARVLRRPARAARA